MSDEFLDAERAVLAALQVQDLDALGALLTDDFLITTAGWIAEPADKPTWLAGLAQHIKLHDYDLRLLAVRRYGETAVALVETTQKGSSGAGELWEYTFRYTDVWVRRHEGWLLAVRHASIIRL